jgi:hypothetical protein
MRDEMTNEKSKVLPENFAELLAAGDIAALKAVFDTCAIDARKELVEGKYSDANTALHFKEIPEELARWLVAQGLNVDTPNERGDTPLHQHAYYGSDLVEVLLELGADVNNNGARNDQTPLARAAIAIRVQAVETLLKHGANPHIEGGFINPSTPLVSMLCCCKADCLKETNEVADIAKLLLRAGNDLTGEMQGLVWNIGLRYWHYRDYLSKDEQTSALAGLERLYHIFRVDPVPRYIEYDGTSPISVPPGSHYNAFEVLREFLVPETGEPKTVQGEAIRIADELQHVPLVLPNDYVSYERRKKRRAEFQMIAEALLHYLSTGVAVPASKLEELERSFRFMGIWQCPSDDNTRRVYELTVDWVRQNKRPIPLEGNRYKG